jgi:hypothetical protein
VSVPRREQRHRSAFAVGLAQPVELDVVRDALGPRPEQAGQAGEDDPAALLRRAAAELADVPAAREADERGSLRAGVDDHLDRPLDAEGQAGEPAVAPPRAVVERDALHVRRHPRAALEAAAPGGKRRAELDPLDERRRERDHAGVRRPDALAGHRRHAVRGLLDAVDRRAEDDPLPQPPREPSGHLPGAALDVVLLRAAAEPRDRRQPAPGLGVGEEVQERHVVRLGPDQDLGEHRADRLGLARPERRPREVADRALVPPCGPRARPGAPRADAAAHDLQAPEAPQQVEQDGGLGERDRQAVLDALAAREDRDVPAARALRRHPQTELGRELVHPPLPRPDPVRAEVDRDALDARGVDLPADPGAGLEHADVDPRSQQRPRARQAAQPGADDDRARQG